MKHTRTKEEKQKISAELRTVSAHYITLGNGKRVGIAAYVAGIRQAIAEPETEFTHGLRGWWPETGEKIRADFRRSVHDRINRHRPPVELRDRDRIHPQTAHSINTPGVVVRAQNIPPRWRARLAHRG